MLTRHLLLSKLTIALQKSSNGDLSMLLSSSVLRATFNLQIQSSSSGDQHTVDLRKDSEEEPFPRESTNLTRDGSSVLKRRNNDQNLLRAMPRTRKLPNARSSLRNELLPEQISERSSPLRRTRIKGSISTFQIKERFDLYEVRTTMFDTRLSITTVPRPISATLSRANGERQEVHNSNSNKCNDLDSAYSRTRVVLDQELRRSTPSEQPQLPMPTLSELLLKHLSTRSAISNWVPTPMRTSRRRSMLSTLHESILTSRARVLTSESSLQLPPRLFVKTLPQQRSLPLTLMEEISCKMLSVLVLSQVPSSTNRFKNGSIEFSQGSIRTRFDVRLPLLDLLPVDHGLISQEVRRLAVERHRRFSAVDFPLSTRRRKPVDFLPSEVVILQRSINSSVKVLVHARVNMGRNPRSPQSRQSYRVEPINLRLRSLATRRAEELHQAHLSLPPHLQPRIIVVLSSIPPTLVSTRS